MGFEMAVLGFGGWECVNARPDPVRFQVYAGITNDLAARQAAHGERFIMDPITTSPVTRGEARAIEQALIVENPSFQNIRNSISPNHPYYQDAVDWGKQWLRSNGY